MEKQTQPTGAAKRNGKISWPEQRVETVIAAMHCNMKIEHLITGSKPDVPKCAKNVPRPIEPGGGRDAMSDAEYYEALSRKYSSAVRFLLKLESGRYALFTNGRDLICIDTLEEVCKHPSITEYIPHQPIPVREREEIDLDYLTDL